MKKIFSGKRKNILAASGYLLFCLTLALLVSPEYIGLGIFSLGFIGNFYDQNAFNEEGSNIWWLERIDPTTDAEVIFGQVSGVKVMIGGSGYAAAPTVGFTGGGGTGAAATALISNGKVVKVIMTNNGSGYTSAPTVAFTPAGADPGVGAAATAYWSDGWHLMPARLSVNFTAGQKQTNVIGEDKQIFTTKKEVAEGMFTVELNQNDTHSKNFFAKEAFAYDWRLFQHIGPSRGEAFQAYRYIAKVRFPEYIEEKRQGGTLTIEGTILQNKSAVSVTNSTDLPVSGLVGAYSVAAKRLYSEDEEVVTPSI
jgi:hypothetical protein